MTAKVFQNDQCSFKEPFKTAPFKTRDKMMMKLTTTIFFRKNKTKQPRLPSTTITKKYYYEFKLFL